MQRGSYYKIEPSTHILTFITLDPSLSSPCPNTTPNPSTTTLQLPSIQLVTGGYRFSRGRMNRKRHKTHKSCSSILPFASKILSRTSVSFPTEMRPPRHYSATTSRGKTSRCGALSRFVAIEVSWFVLYFLFFFNTSATILNFLLGCGQYILFTYYWFGSQLGSTIWNGLH